MKKIKILFAIFAIAVAMSNVYANTPLADTLYIVQVKSHSNIKVIESAKKSLMAKYPDKKFLTQFRSPNYFLSVGYFNSQEEAEAFKKEIEAEFPGSSILPIEKKQ